MKVVHFISRLAFGGAETMAINLALLMKNMDIDIEIWTLYESLDKEVEKYFLCKLSKSDIKVKCAKKPIGKIGYKTIKNINTMIKSSKADIIHSHIEEMSIFIQLANIFNNTTIVHTIHNNKINHKLIHKFLACNKNYNFVSISNEVSKTAKDILKINTPIIINGIDTNLFLCKERNYNDVKKFIAIGRLTEQKNHLFLIKAYSNFVKKMKNSIDRYVIPILEIYGAGDLYNELKNYIICENMNDYIILKGTSSNVDKILEQSDCYLMPSKWEGLSISLLEAMASGLPIIASRIKGNKELLNEKNSLLISINDTYDLEECIVKVFLDSNLRKNIGTQASMDSKSYSIEVTAKEYMNFYNNVLSK
jgi:glycosyltransferase EpsD